MNAQTRTQMLRVDEVAQFLGCSKSTVWRLSADGTLPSPVKFGGTTRWLYSELIEFVNAMKQAR